MPVGATLPAPPGEQSPVSPAIQEDHPGAGRGDVQKAPAERHRAVPLALPSTPAEGALRKRKQSGPQARGLPGVETSRGAPSEAPSGNGPQKAVSCLGGLSKGGAPFAFLILPFQQPCKVQSAFTEEGEDSEGLSHCSRPQSKGEAVLSAPQPGSAIAQGLGAPRGWAEGAVR